MTTRVRESRGTRKKGRDLYDLFVALELKLANPTAVVECFLRYMEHGKHKVSRAQFEANLDAKVRDPAFVEDIQPLLASGVEYDGERAAELVSTVLLARLSGKPWAGQSK